MKAMQKSWIERLQVAMPALGQPEVWVTLAVYCVVIAAMWSWYGLGSGLGYETGLVWPSDTGSNLEGFIYRGNALRPFTSVFYHLAYLLAKVFRVNGSFVSYQLVYAALWVGRGFLVFLIVRRLVGGALIFSYTAGTLTLFHASDGSLNWVGQLNQFGFIFWTLLSVYCCTTVRAALGTMGICRRIVAVHRLEPVQL